MLCPFLSNHSLLARPGQISLPLSSLDRVKHEQRNNSCERCSSCDEAKRGAEVQQHYEACLDLGPTSASPRGRGHGLTLTLGVFVADVESDSVADGVIGVGDRVVKVLPITVMVKNVRPGLRELDAGSHNRIFDHPSNVMISFSVQAFYGRHFSIFLAGERPQPRTHEGRFLGRQDA